MKIERAFSKEKILELYLNEIYLGIGAYGVAAASLLYFNKSVHELNLPEAAYLAALPKGPNNYHPFRRRDDAIERRNYVLDRMVEDRFVTPQQAEEAKKDPLTVTTRSTGAQIAASEYFAEEVRRYINDKYSEKKLYEGGLSVRTTLDPNLQKAARKALTDGFVKYDEAQGYRGALQKIEVTGDWGARAGRHQGARGHPAMAAGGRARGDGAGRAHRLPAVARAGRRAGQATRLRQHHA